MIALNSNCLLFQLANGESIPCSADMISVEVSDQAESLLDPEMLQHAAASVFHYFRTELERDIVTVGEFSLALEKALGKLGCPIQSADATSPSGEIKATDLRWLARDAGDCLELRFFPRLRDELREKLRQAPRVVRFSGLRGCVKHITGARRWSRRCEQTSDQIVAFLRHCLTSEPEQPGCALVVE